MRILVAGGAGYIGSHCVYGLLKEGHEIMVYDSLVHSNLNNLVQIRQMTEKQVGFVEGDIQNESLLSNTVGEFKPEAIMHLAALKAAGESVGDPKGYYNNNVVGSKVLLDVCLDHGVDKLIFSSTASVYGEQDVQPILESAICDPINPYGNTKMFIERMLNDYHTAYGINSVSLRYFNAAGADESGKIGEDPTSLANVIPLLMETLVGRRNEFTLYGNQFSTSDGTQERDYIHVTDLAVGHSKALDYLNGGNNGAHIFNLGTGVPTSNLTLMELAEKISGKDLNYTVSNPRPGDPDILYADASKAKQLLKWEAKYDIEKIIQTAWNWHSIVQVS